jgi:hypothetical protein
VHLCLAPLVTAAVHADVTAVQALLRRLTPLRPAPDLTPKTDRRLLAALLSATRAMPEIGRWNQQVLATLVACGELLIPARPLSGEEVSEFSTLADAKIANRVVTLTDGGGRAT